jgi:hypothetical protein
MKITVKEAASRVLATTIQAATGCALVLVGLVLADTATEQAVVGALLGSFAVPVLTAVQRYSQAWLAQQESIEE